MKFLDGAVAWLKAKYKFNYYRLHWMYICFMTLLGALAIYFVEGNIDFIDSLFMSSSAISGTGLSTVDLSVWLWPSQAAIASVMVVGNPVLMTLVPVQFRKMFFSRRFNLEQQRHSPEFQALQIVFYIVIAYYVLTHLFCIGILIAWAYDTPDAMDILVSRNQTAYQWGTFQVISSFANSGMTTLNDNMMAWNHMAVPLLMSAYLTLAGNTAFPIFLRIIVYFLHRFASKKNKAVYDHLLTHPRRYYTHIFLRKQTWYLFLIILIINVLQTAAFIALDWNSPAIDGMDTSTKLLNCFFSSVVTRTSGFNSVDITVLNPAMLVLYAIIMYISSTPVVVAVRTTDENNGIEVEEEIEDENAAGKEAAAEEELIVEVDGDGDGSGGKQSKGKKLKKGGSKTNAGRKSAPGSDDENGDGEKLHAGDDDDDDDGDDDDEDGSEDNGDNDGFGEGHDEDDGAYKEHGFEAHFDEDHEGFRDQGEEHLHEGEPHHPGRQDPSRPHPEFEFEGEGDNDGFTDFVSSSANIRPPGENHQDPFDDPFGDPVTSHTDHLGRTLNEDIEVIAPEGTAAGAPSSAPSQGNTDWAAFPPFDPDSASERSGAPFMAGGGTAPTAGAGFFVNTTFMRAPTAGIKHGAKQMMAGAQKVRTGTEKVFSQTVQGTGKVFNQTVQGTGKVFNQTVQGTGKVFHSTKQGTEKVFQQTVQGTEKVFQQTVQGTEKVFQQTVQGTEKVFHQTLQGGEFVLQQTKAGAEKIKHETDKFRGQAEQQLRQMPGQIWHGMENLPSQLLQMPGQLKANAEHLPGQLKQMPGQLMQGAEKFAYALNHAPQTIANVGRKKKKGKKRRQDGAEGAGEGALEGEGSLNPYNETLEDGDGEGEEPLLLMTKPPENVKTQAKMLLTQDTILLIVILCLICVFEHDLLVYDENVDVFKILFEMASTYGTVGLSLGYPGLVSSLSTKFTIYSKIMMIMVMLMGRHRGLPTSIDKAIQMNLTDEVIVPPSDNAIKEQEERKIQEEEEKKHKKEEKKRRKQLEKEMKMRKKVAETNIKALNKERERSKDDASHAGLDDMELSHFDSHSKIPAADGVERVAEPDGTSNPAPQDVPTPEQASSKKGGSKGKQTSYAQLIDDLEDSPDGGPSGAQPFKDNTLIDF